ncbi:MAG: hypothetical protein ACI3WR_00365 [Oscillospiraceae bacterium]
MNELPLLLEGGAPAGKLRWVQEGLYYQIEALADQRREGIYRAYLSCENGERLLGVMEPRGQGMYCRKRFAEQQLRGLGRWQGGLLRRSGGDGGWQPYAGELGGEWGGRVGAEGALTRPEGELRLVALPYDRGAPFPLTELFCLAQLRQIGGRRYVVYAFSPEGKPVLPR